MPAICVAGRGSVPPLAFVGKLEYYADAYRGKILETYVRRLQRAIEQIGEQQVRSSFESYIIDMSARKGDPICDAYARDNAVVYKWDVAGLVHRLVLLHPKLKQPKTDEAMISALKSFLRIH